MTKIPLSLQFVLGFSVAGLLFSGYLTFVKLFSGACAFNETCPNFLGYPTCWYGFAMYVILVAFGYFIARAQMTYRTGMIAIAVVAFIGVIFAGYFTATELPKLFLDGFKAYFLGLPTCALGLIFYLLIFAVAMLGLSARQR